MDDAETLSREIEARALARILEERSRGAIRPLEEHLEEFPAHHWPAVARAWLQVTGELGAGPMDAPRTTNHDLFGAYRVLRELGRGGQGRVFLAEHTGLGRKVALKVLSEAGHLDGMAARRFQREAEVASRLDHPGICTVYESGVQSGTFFIAMQYLEGETLARLIARTRAGDRPASSAVTFSSEGFATAAPDSRDDTPTPSSQQRTRPELLRVVELLEGVARALHVAHEAGVLHRDLKPANVMVTPESRGVIMDFGLARGEDPNQPTLTREGDLMGTPAYMAPEQLAAQRMPVDRRADVWALGVTLYESLTLDRPFAAPTREALYQQILVKEPPDPCRADVQLPRDLGTVIATCLDKDPDRRYQTALDVAEELRRVREREPIAARPTPWWIRMQRWAQRSPGVAASLGLALLILGAGLVVSLVLLDRSRASEAGRREALQEKTASFDRYVQMSDPAVLRFLVEEADELWPRREEKVPEMNAWLDRARELAGRIQDRLDDLATLRARALPPSEEDRIAEAARRRERHPELVAAEDEASAALEKVRAALARDRGGRRREQLEEREQDLEAELTAIREDPRFGERLVWSFENPDDARRHRELSRLADAREGFAALVQAVEQRRAFASSLARRSLIDEKGRWERCRADIRTRDAYGDLDLAPQLGLVPLGRDRDSGLWEFWHVGSGERPAWEGDELAGKARTDTSSGIVLVLVPGGRFWMGCQDRDREERNYDPHALVYEGPVREVALAPFFIAKHETTQAQWWRIRGENPSTYPAGRDFGDPTEGGDDSRIISLTNPAENVSWTDCIETAFRFGLTLPTEAQWEYAARAGTTTRWWTGDTVVSIQGAGNTQDAYAMSRGNPQGEPELNDGHLVHAPVGSFAPNAFGLHDVIGNVHEWCRDEYATHQRAFTALERPLRPGDGLRSAAAATFAAFRGGCFGNPSAYTRSGHRDVSPLELRNQALGCRFARPLEARAAVDR